MKKLHLGLLVGIIVIVMAGGVYLLQKSDPKPVESNTAPETQQAIGTTDTSTAVQERKGVFAGVGVKSGSGDVKLVKRTDKTYSVTLGSDFVVQSGPDLYVGLGNNGAVDASTLFSKLDKFTGQQEYSVPNTIDTAKYNQVFVYCKEFSVPFAVATIQ